MDYIFNEVGCGHGPDYGMQHDTEHKIYDVYNQIGEHITDFGSFLHRFSHFETEYSAIYEGHILLYKVIREQESNMLKEFYEVRKIERMIENAFKRARIKYN